MEAHPDNAEPQPREADDQGKEEENKEANQTGDTTVGEGEQMGAQQVSTQQQETGQTSNESADKPDANRVLGDMVEALRRQINTNAQEQVNGEQGGEEQENQEFEFIQQEDDQTEMDKHAFGAAEDDQVHALPPDEPMETEEAKETQEMSTLPHQGGDQGQTTTATEVEEDTVMDMVGDSNVMRGTSLLTPSVMEADKTSTLMETLPTEPSTLHDYETCLEQWKKYVQATEPLALTLCEQLKLILEPTLATKLKGDYRTGKRLNMRKIIPYIASDFKKDKIWLRRTKPSKRDYQVLLALDDSQSMSESKLVQMAFESIALISTALARLEVGQLGVVGFGQSVDLVHPLGEPFNVDSGAKMVQHFGFQQPKTNVAALLSSSLSLLDSCRQRYARTESWQLSIIVSDGICEQHDLLATYCRQALEQHIMLVFIILDDKPPTQSILATNNVTYTVVNGKMTLSMAKYLDTFPFDYYVVLKSVDALPHVLADTLRQYFSFVNM
jgi:midasin (ATPase involved in ribosome maturation)